MSQLELFSVSPSEPTVAQAEAERRRIEARARSTDPASSHEAARKVNENHSANFHRWRVTDLVYMHPGCTSKELVKFLDDKDRADGLDRHEIARRLPEAEANGDIHRRKEGKAELRWFPGEAT